MDINTRCDASRGRKSKAEGGKKSKATQEYTPLVIIGNRRSLKVIIGHYVIIGNYRLL